MTLSSLIDIVSDVFGGDYPDQPLEVGQIMARAAAIYVIGLAIVRAGKGRLIGRVTSLDIILGFILGSILSRGITGHASISGTTAAAATLVFLHWLFTRIACHWHWFGSLLKGHERQLVQNGKLIPENMSQSHISTNDLLEEMRLKGISRLEDVSAAFKERNGQMSFLTEKREPRVIEVAVSDGVQIIRVEMS